MRYQNILALAVAGVLAGCATSGTPQDFGSSVKSLVDSQTLNAATLTSPSTAPVTGVEPDYANNVLKAFRESVSKPEEVREPIEMVLMGYGGGY